MTKGLYKFYWDCGRMGDLQGLFFADSVDVAEAMGHEIYFGEVLGKHSEIYDDLKEADVTLLTSDPAIIKILSGFGIETGFDPIERFLDQKAEGQYND